MDSDMISSLILQIVKADPRTSMSVLIANIHSQLRYTLSYRKAWIGLETSPAYYNDRLLRGCQVFKRLFWSFKLCQDAFVYCKPLPQLSDREAYGITHIISIVQGTLRPTTTGNIGLPLNDDK
ncbi:hypothetical protein GOBAR_AA10633 [Gossypium barbadense]|uniref:Uncharacterized protein n=1 Tax=Gossypium barbadense TaxID=3634 RepID=A0A2P5Y397_GOSBA|nr:hypothetical protein GOBAR_AA10633 [Gossypium barbadense]